MVKLLSVILFFKDKIYGKKIISIRARKSLENFQKKNGKGT